MYTQTVITTVQVIDETKVKVMIRGTGECREWNYSKAEDEKTENT